MRRCKLLAVAYFLHYGFCHQDPPPPVAHVRHRAITTHLIPGVVLTTSHSWIEGDRPVDVTAFWRDLPKNVTDAWVGLYLVGENATEVVPLKYNFCNESLHRTVSGSKGRLTFRILNYRADVFFGLFHGWEQPVLIAMSDIIRVRSPGFPTGVRLSLTRAPGEVAVTWTSTSAHTIDAYVKYEMRDVGGHVVNQGESPVVSAASYARNELCGAPANAEGFRDPGVFYTGKIKDIVPGSVVTYRVGSEGAWSRDFNFNAPPGLGGSVKIFAFGDLGFDPRDDSAQGEGEPLRAPPKPRPLPGVPNTTAAMLMDHRAAPANLVLHNGDLSYAMGYNSMWEVFHDNIEDLSAEVPWMVTIGNHERDWPGTNSTSFGGMDSMGECGVPATRRFAAHPFASKRLPPHDQPWYAIALGVVSIIAVSTEHELAQGSLQHSWLEQALRAVDRFKTPWLIVAGHRPYVVNSDWTEDTDNAAYLQSAIGSLLEEYSVDLILGGHHHSYQRSCFVRGGQCSAEGRGPVVLNVGMAGASLNKLNMTLPPLFRYGDDKHFGYCRINADSSRLTAEFVHSASHNIYDSVTLLKHRPTDIYA